MGFKRKLFYLGGFDPRGVQYYYALFVEQMARHATKSGESITVSPRSNPFRARSDWRIDNPAQDVVTDYSFLRWEDIARRGWIRNPVDLAGRSLKAYFHMLREGDYRTGRTLGYGPLITLFYPAILALLIPMLIGSPIFTVALLFAPWWAAALVGLMCGTGIAVPILRGLRAPWLLRFFVFNSELSAGRQDPDLDARLALFAEEIAAGIEGYDEVLLVAHSNGCILAVPLMAQLLERWGGRAPDTFHLVTLGHCIPLVACRRDAHAFRARLDVLSQSEFSWTDIGSPPDGAGYYGVDPLRLYGGEPKSKVDLLSPRFHIFYDARTYHKGWANKYEIHFDYLRSGDRISPLDLPSLVTSSRQLDQSVQAFKALA